MKKTLIAVLIILFCVPKVFAQFGLVFDPTSYTNAVLMYTELIQTVEQMQAQYQLLTRMAQSVPVNMATQYRAPATPWTEIQPPTDTYGRLAPLASSLNGNGAPLAGYSQATEALDSYGSLLDTFSSEGQGHLKARYGAVEFTDGVNLHTIQTAGDIQKNSTATDSAIRSLENDSLSQDPDFNTEIAVLNKINAASMVSLRGTQDTNRLLAAVLEQQLATSQRERDAATLELNAHIARLRGAGQVWERYSSTMADSITNFRLP